MGALSCDTHLYDNKRILFDCLKEFAENELDQRDEIFVGLFLGQ